MADQDKEKRTLMGFHATLSERAEIKEAADWSGGSVASWLRMLALDKARLLKAGREKK